MFQQHFNTANATPVSVIEAQILDGLTQCKSVTEIAQDIAKLLEDQSAILRAPKPA